MNRPMQVSAGWLALALAACSPALTPGGQQVRIQSTRPFGCTELGRLRGIGDSVDHSTPDEATQSSHSELRNDAAEMGANTVWVEGSDILGSTVTARAFRCDGTQTTPPNLSASSPAPQPDSEDRLKKLKELFDKGLITQDEYDRRRAAVLQTL
jgi:hypothetical protein